MATASVFGLAIGAVIGGRLADRVGRKAVLIAALAGLAKWVHGLRQCC